MPPLSSRKSATFPDLLVLAPLTFFFLFYRLGAGSLASWDEAYYAVVSRELLRSHQWLDLYFTGALWFEKPPLTFWATALVYKIGGINEFTARFFSALCGAGTVFLTYFIGRNLFNRWTGLCAALVLLSSSHFLRFARFGMTDAPLTFFMTLAFYLFWRGQRTNRLLVLSGIAIGLAVMTKGVVGLLVFPVIWIYCLAAGRLEVLRRPAYWAGVALAVLTAAPWHIYQTIMHHDLFLQNAMLNQVFLRATTVLADHKGNCLFYLRTMINKFHPWILVGVFSAPLFLWKAVKDRDEESIFLAVWMFFIFLVFSAAKTKLPWYIFPVYPALSVTIAYVFTLLFTERRAGWAMAVFAAALFLQVDYSHILEIEYSRPIKTSAPLVEKMVPRDATVYLYRYHEQPAGVFYFQRTVGYLESPAEFGAAASRGDFYCFVRSQDLKELEPVSSKDGVSLAGPFDGLYFLFISRR